MQNLGLINYLEKYEHICHKSISELATLYVRMGNAEFKLTQTLRRFAQNIHPIPNPKTKPDTKGQTRRVPSETIGNSGFYCNFDPARLSCLIECFGVIAAMIVSSNSAVS